MRRAIEVVPMLLAVACAGPASEEAADELGESSSGAGTSESSSSGESESTSESSSSGESESTSESETGEPPPPECNPDAFVHAFAPHPYEADLVVPIDVLSLDGQFEFRLANQSTWAEATMVFQLGEQGGLPLLDFRQNPVVVRLDGELLLPDEFPLTPLGPSPDDLYRVIERELEPCSVHELHVEYWLDRPIAPQSAGYDYLDDPSRVTFDFFMSNALPGRYLESWLPANMPWDRHPFGLGLRVVDGDTEHVVITNGTVEQLGVQDWYVEFPDDGNAISPMLLVKAGEGLLTGTVVHPIHGVDVPWDIYVYDQNGATIDMIDSALVGHFDDLNELGPYPHERLVAYVVYQNLLVSSYRGGVTASLLSMRGALLATWWGRAIEPATYADGWLIEAWNGYLLGQLVSEPIDPAEPPWELYDTHPLARVPPTAAGEDGPRVFAAIAAVMGANALRIAMRELIDQGVPRSLTTAELEQHLHCASGEAPEVRAIFHRWVYGLAGEPEPAPPCP